MAATPPTTALALRLRDFPAILSQDDTPAGMFTRLLETPLADAAILRACRLADYGQLAGRLSGALDRFNEHLTYHAIEAKASAQVHDDSRLILPYCADLGHWLTTIDGLMLPSRAAAEVRWPR